MTVPEYSLSFQLKLYESINKKDFKLANGFLNVLNMINANVRNVLDESDEILKPKYQLIYTVGKQVNGDELRWNVIQAVLKRVPGHMERLWTEYGDEKIEFDEKYCEKYDVFPPCRILDECVFEKLKLALIDDFLEGRLDIDFPRVIADTKESIRSLLTQKHLDPAAFKIIEDFTSSKQSLSDTIMILNGLLRFEILKLALMRRWRVNYGVDENGRRKMAIPFRGKDFAAESTEFGQLDVAICFTQLSYYYSGNFQTCKLNLSILQYFCNF